jgi:phosphatidylserine decarboxylase
VTRRSLLEARRYVVGAMVAEIVLAPLRLLKGRLLLAVVFACAVFFRDPSRRSPRAADTLYAPADGVVLDVDVAADPWLPGGDALRISTFLAIYDVHVNRSPSSGRIALAEETSGGFWPAFLDRAHSNHRKRLAIDDENRRVVLVQYAGMLARRISSWAWLGDRVERGDRIALIHLGSRADVLVPAAEARPLVEPGRRVRAGVTPIARYVAGEAAI